MFRNYMTRSCNCNVATNMDVRPDDYVEEKCSDVSNSLDMYSDDCDCGYDEFNVFPDNPVLGQSYVPIQRMDKTFIPSVGLKMGTIFPELVRPYMPGQSMCEIQYLKATNPIKGGCNRW